MRNSHAQLHSPGEVVDLTSFLWMLVTKSFCNYELGQSFSIDYSWGKTPFLLVWCFMYAL